MKTNKFTLSLLATGALLMSSCTNEDTPIMPSVSDNTVSFSTYMGRSLSRAASTTSDNLANFGVTAFIGDGSGYADGLVPDFMYNQLVEKSESGWTYAPVKYWPSDTGKKISFFAYSPYASTPFEADDCTSAVMGLSGNSEQGDPTITFQVGTEVSKQIDLVYAKAVDKTSTCGIVNFEFKHALSRVGFKVIGWEPASGAYDNNTTVTINSVKLATVRKTATLNLNTGEWADPVDADALQSYTLSARNGLLQNNVVTASDTEAKQLNLDDDYMMILPDLSGSDQYVLFVDYTVETADESLESGKVTIRNNVYRRLTPHFESGKSYNIVVHLGMSGQAGEDDGDDDGETPVDPDPDPENPIDPTPPLPNSRIRFSISVSAWDCDDDKNISLVGKHPVLTMAQEDFHINGSMAMSRSAGQFTAKILAKDGGENMLRHDVAIDGSAFTIPCETIKWDQMESGSAYTLVVEDPEGAQYSGEVGVVFATMSYLLEIEDGSKDTKVPFATRSTSPAIVVSFGDGTVTGECTSFTTATCKHAYAEAGAYRVKVLAQPDFGSTQCPAFNTFPSQLTALETPLLNQGGSIIGNIFEDCAKLATIPANLFENMPHCTAFKGTFIHCAGVSEIPEGLFSFCPLATTFSSVFSFCTGLEEIPAGLFSYSPNAKCFDGAFNCCSNLSEIPAALFADNPAAESFNETFRGCVGLTEIPENLFARNASAASFDGCFEYCSGIADIPEHLFDNNPNAASFCHTFCSTKVSNIPANLFSATANAEKCDFAFYNTKITAIPSELFQNCPNLKSVNFTFASTPLADIPATIFSSCPLLENIGGTFSSTQIMEVPSGIFASNGELKSTYSKFTHRSLGQYMQLGYSYPDGGTFWGCSKLKTIPIDIFDNAQKITNFSKTFAHCSDLSSRLPELWLRDNVEESSQCFLYCYLAPNYGSVPSGW